MNEEIILFGLPIPDSSPLFLSILAVHVTAGIISVISGLVALLARKAHGRHDWFGTVYYRGIIVVFTTNLLLSVIRWPHDNHLAVLGVFSFLAAFLGRRAHRKLWHRWPVWHMAGMGSSYILMLTAFYVDNGKNLPLWKLLPEILYWLLPAMIGIPLMIRTMMRNPLMKLGRRR